METPNEQQIAITILDSVTGEIREDHRWTYWWWGGGNGGCDCNRQLLFDIDDDWDEDDDSYNDCLGWEQFYIIKTSHGCLNFLNEWYPHGIGDCIHCANAYSEVLDSTLGQ